jgi:hypothetical protein
VDLGFASHADDALTQVTSSSVQPFGEGPTFVRTRRGRMAAVGDKRKFGRSAVVWGIMDGDVAVLVEARMQLVCLSQPARTVERRLEPKRGTDSLGCSGLSAAR